MDTDIETSSLSVERYSSVGDKIKTVIEEKTDLVVPDKTLQAWKRLMELTKVFDDHVDNNTNSNNKLSLFESAIHYLSDPTQITALPLDVQLQADKFKPHFDSLAPEQQQTFVLLVGILGRVTILKHETSDATDLGQLSRLEGQSTSQLLLLFLSDENKKSSKYHDTAQYIKKLGRVGNVLDDVIHYDIDLKTSIHNAPNNNISRIKLGGAALNDAVYVMTRTPQALYKELIISVLHNYEDKV